MLYVLNNHQILSFNERFYVLNSLDPSCLSWIGFVIENHIMRENQVTPFDITDIFMHSVTVYNLIVNTNC